MKNLYDNKWVGYGYDLLSSFVWLPSKSRLYDRIISLVGFERNEKILELGCGTGFLTKKLVATQATVTSVDQSAGMLVRAKVRAPEGKFIQSDILNFVSSEKYDYVVFSFVLHEFNALTRNAALELAKSFLNENGKIIIADFALPQGRIMKNVFPKLIGLWENKDTLDVLRNGFYSEIKGNNLSILSHAKLYQGRVQLIILNVNYQ